MKKTIALIFAAWSLCLLPAWAAADEHEHCKGDCEAEQRLEEARQRLEEAASALAEAYSSAFGKQGKHDGRAMLGVLLDSNGDRRGLPLSGITPGGGADQAGLKTGDILTHVDDTALVQPGESPMRVLTDFLDTVAAGDAVRVRFQRDGEADEVDVITQSFSYQSMRLMQDKVNRAAGDVELMRTRVFGPDALGEAPTFMDVDGTLASYFDVDAGVLAIRVPDDSELQPGDILLAIGDTEVQNAEQAFNRLVWLDDEVAVKVKRKGKNKTVNVTEDEFSDGHAAVRVIRIDKRVDAD